MTLYAVSQAIRKAGGQVLLCGNQSFGFVFRAEIGCNQCRIIVPSGKQRDPYPSERNTLTHVVSTLSNLEQWLTSLSQIRTPTAQVETLTLFNDARQWIPTDESLLC